MVVNVDLHGFVPAPWVKDDFLNDVPNSPVRRGAAVFIRLRKSVFKVPHQLCDVIVFEAPSIRRP